MSDLDEIFDLQGIHSHLTGFPTIFGSHLEFLYETQKQTKKHLGNGVR